MKVIGQMVEVGAGVLVGPPGVTEGTTAVLVGVLLGPPGVVVGVFVVVAVRVAVLVAAVVTAAVAVAVLQTGGEKVSICPAERPPVLHSYWV